MTSSPPLSILVVEDESAHVEAIRRALLAVDPARVVRSVSSLLEYRESAAAQPPDIALINQDLPDGNAVEALGTELAGTPFPVVIMTSFGEESTAVAAIKAGALDYLVKSPEAIAEMPHTIERALREWRLQTERERVVAALAASEEQLRIALDAAKLGVWRFDTVRDQFTCDERALQHFDLPHCGPMPMAEVAARFHPDDAARVRQEIATSLDPTAGGDRFVHEYRVIHRDGVVRWLTFEVKAHFGGEGSSRRPTFVIGTSRDITDRRETAAALAKSELLYRTLVEAATDGIVLTDLGGRHIYNNSAYYRTLGLDRDKLPHPDSFEIVHPDDKPWVKSQMAMLLDSGTMTGEYRVRHGDGQWVYHLTTATVIRDEAGKPTGILSIIRDTTESRKAEAALRESEERLRMALDAAELGVWRHDVVRDEVTCDERERAHNDFSSCGPFPIATLIACLHPEDVARVRRRMAAALDPSSDEDRFVHEYRVIHRDGSIHWLAVQVNVHFEGEGPARQPTFVIGTSADITERKRAEEAQRRSEALLKAQFDNSPDIILILNRDLRFVAINRVMAGPDTREELVGKDGILVLPEKVREQVRSAITTCFATGEIQELEHEIGDGIWVRSRIVPMQSQGVIDHVMAIATNITEQRRAERAAAASERKFQTIFNAVNDGVFISGLDGRILEINEPACRMLGYSRGELLQKNLRDLDTAEHAARVSSRIEQIEERGQILYEAVQRAKDGRLVPVEVSARPIELDGLTALAGVVRDITERKRGEGERLELERRLLHAQKLESLGVLAGGIAHDFNNLLMAILGNLDLAGLTLPPTSPARNSIDQAIQATRRATDLTRQLLAYSGRGRFVVTRVDLAELARENADLFRSVMARTVTLNLSTNLQPCPIEADPGQVQQVIMNLITNASEAVGESGGVVTLTTGLITCDEAYLEQSRLEDKPNAGRFAYVEVTDTGCGMTAGTQERLFDPFFSTKFTGRGLGMSAVLGIVRGHGGAILVDSKEGLGTTVRVLFPTLQTELPKPAPPVLAPAAGRLESRLAGKVLVVDDESAVRALCQRYLEHLGFEALEAASGERALSLIAESNSSIGLIVLDLTMPEMDGVVAFHEIARRWPTIPVILSSGFSEEDVMQRFSGAVPAAFVQKPYRLQELQESVAKALAAGREAAERQR